MGKQVAVSKQPSQNYDPKCQSILSSPKHFSIFQAIGLVFTMAALFRLTPTALFNPLLAKKLC